MTPEGKFKKKLKERLSDVFPGCMILQPDPTQIQGIPDLLVLYKDKWAALEVKRSSNASHRPNQDYYVSQMNDMSYAAFVSPENEEVVLDEIQQAFGV
jgi:hypothetical protein